MVLLLLFIICISPLAALIPAGRQLLLDRRKLTDVLPMAGMLGLLGLFYVPIVQVDLSRYFLQLDTIRNFSSFGEFFQTLDSTQKVQVSQQVFFYVMSKLTWNNLLPFVVVILVATIGLYIIKDYISDKQFALPLRGLIYLTFILFMPWGQVITNIRYISSLALFMLAFYRDVYQQKRDVFTFGVYLIGFTMHIATLLFLGIRLLMFVVQKLTSDIKKSHRIIMILVIVVLVVLMSQTSVFKMFASKAIYYINGGGDGSAVQQWFAQADRSLGRSLGKHIEMVFTFIQLCLLTPLLIKARKLSSAGEFRMLIFTALMLFVTFIWTFLAGTTWIRFAFLVDFCAVFLIVAEEKYLDDTYLILFNQTVWIGMLLWSIVWQAYQYTGSEMMTRSDFFNILYPFRWLLK
ncbi:hypothetical protein [Lacticaseibacillus sp. GG6-2]